MKIYRPVDNIVSKMREYLMADPTYLLFKDEAPLRLDLLSSLQMESHGIKIAAQHEIQTTKHSHKILKRLSENEEIINRVLQMLTETIKNKHPIAPASEWLLDNFYLIQEQIEIIRKHLPKNYSLTLPVLSSGKSEGLPRVYDIALEIISHSDGRLDLVNLTSFIEGYQTIKVLTIGELWAIPIMLRLAIIENIRRIASRIAIDRIDKNEAIIWADQLIKVAQEDAKNIIVATAEMAKSDIPLNSAFVSEITRRMQGKAHGLSIPLSWIEQQLSDTGHSIAEFLNNHSQTQTTDQISMRNSIESIRLLKTTEWKKFVESVSVVEKILRSDVSGIYPLMDFGTRDYYRHIIEKIAKKTQKKEHEIASDAISLSKKKTQGTRQQHVGYFLIDKGYASLCQVAAVSLTPSDHLKSFFKKIRLLLYAGGTFLLALLPALILSTIIYRQPHRMWLAIGIGILSFVVLGYFGGVLINWISTLLVKPKPLPRLDFSEKIPKEFTTIVAVPCLVINKVEIETLINDLEVRFLSNPEKNLFYCLLTDFTDAPQETMPGDAELLSLVSEGIRSLNLKYKNNTGEERFFLMHRPRKWNKKEKCWMSHERKRGKLSELNSLLRNGGNDDFSIIVGDTNTLSHVRYVITLDADTLLPREAAWKMIATMAHPLNQPMIDEKTQTVVDGYGILQPLTAVNLPKKNSSVYTRMHSTDAGLDPYTQLVSDVYQDLFDEGSFVGKGIYDIDVFEKILANTFPDNRILSHDLLEGSFVRSGLLTDVQLFEDYPQTYWMDVNRRHRWIRGDWQIATWGLPFVPDSNNKLKRNYISSLSKWKIWDNLKRSLFSPACFLMLLLVWLFMENPVTWTLGLLACFLLTPFVTSVIQFFKKPEELDYRTHLLSIKDSFLNSIAQSALTIICLPFEAYKNTHAIILANWRLLITHKRLLQWTPYAPRYAGNQKTIFDSYLIMFPAVVLVILLSILIPYLQPASIPIALPFLFLWLISPMVVWFVSRPVRTKSFKISSEETKSLQIVGRKTWAFFEDFVSIKDNFLPPDNHQETPIEATAHRTSPTNIGLACLANLSAYDFGYISPFKLVERTAYTFQSLNNMERYKGHFYNWYDTMNLQPLFPKYISTVDSGNFICNMLVLRQGIMELPHQKILNKQLYEGLLHTILAMKALTPTNKALNAIEDYLKKDCAEDPTGLLQHKEQLQRLTVSINEIKENSDFSENMSSWLIKFEAQINDALYNISHLSPWTDLLPLPEHFSSLDALETVPSLMEGSNLLSLHSPVISELRTLSASDETNSYLTKIADAIEEGQKHALQLLSSIETLLNEAADFASVSYDFLYDTTKHLFHIGYNVSEDIKDKSYYDILASEARLAIFTAIAQGMVPQNSWFTLGRLVARDGGAPVLLSWSGSMFEYLMPDLVMPSYENTLLEQTARGVIKAQVAYAKNKGVPWGISESGYNLVDTQLNYQYMAFGVPGLGLKRGLAQDLVIAPYATLLALMIDPEEAIKNLQLLVENGFEGKYGFYEAIDYTPSRMPRGKSHVIVRSFMAHHQGMGFLSIARLLLGDKMQRRFERDPQYQSALLLLKERVPRTVNYHSKEDSESKRITSSQEEHLRLIKTPNTPIPETQLLSNGRYHLMVSNAGGSHCRWKDISITRWRDDMTEDNFGTFCYIKDMDSGMIWSNSYQPTRQHVKIDEAIFSQGHVEFRRVNESFEVKTDIVVSPEDDVAIRRITITNKTATTKNLEVTGYTEIVIAPQAADESHPTFSNLFVQTEINEAVRSIISTRRPRSKNEQPPWMFFMMLVSGTEQKEVSFECDRLRFIGRTNTLAAPQAITTNGKMSNTDGSVLDPVAAIKYQIRLEAKQTATFEIITGISNARDISRTLIDKYRDAHLKNRPFELSWTHSQVLLRQINANESEAQLFNAIAAHILYPNATHRADADIIASNLKDQSGLWGFSISGDLPIVLVRVQNSENTTLVRELIKAHAYWRIKGLKADLVIWNDDYGTYRQLLHDQIMTFVSATSGNIINQPGGIFIRHGDQLSNEDRILFQTAARLIFSDNSGTLREQMAKQKTVKALPLPLKINGHDLFESNLSVKLPPNLLFNNQTGGFTEDGKEYYILSNALKKTPLPWSNILANEQFGTLLTESGTGYSWAENAHAYRLTPWKNDPVTDKNGEAFYIRDDISGKYWSPSPLPCNSGKPYITRNGFGYSIYEHIGFGIQSEMTVFVDTKDPIRFTIIKLKNISSQARKISITGYVEWVLGDTTSHTRMHVVTQKDLETGAIFARNYFNSVFAERVSFFEADGKVKSYTCDRTEFIGRNGSLSAPEAMSREKLSNKYGAALDPCTAIQIEIDLLPGEEKEIIFRLGSERHIQQVRDLVKKYKNLQSVYESLGSVHDFWNNTLNAVSVNTPDPALNVLANGWLVYQTLACRIWGRSGFYQSGGAFGFRDQLQDVLSLMHTRPDITRAQILLAASRQFKEGDVQHWWHPPTGRGVRTACSDDYLWLPFTTIKYIESTGDAGILEEYISYIQGRPLRTGEESYYDLPVFLDEWETIYNHCKRAIQYGLKFGQHGLPLIGAGDWNDGMDKVGEHGRGESVWLGFFLFDILNKFGGLALQQGDTEFYQQCVDEANKLKNNLDKNAWDGNWYRRAYFDDGTPLGSAENEECKIDAISQSWSVLTGAGDPAKTTLAMASLNTHLIDRQNGIIKLLTPAFDKSNLEPGYIKGYVPGVRENGGQYTHAAIWTIMAFAIMKERDKVWELFSMINPVNRTTNNTDAFEYKTEPYVMAADVYGVVPHEGRGGWTWYTGSAGWTYQLIVQYILGIQKVNDKLQFSPCIPDSWPGLSIQYRFGKTLYQIKIINELKQGIVQITLNGKISDQTFIILKDDHKTHEVIVKV